jgi:hypothetical protein
MVLDQFLDLTNPLLKLIFFKFEEGFLFDGIEMFFLDLFNFLLVVFMKILHSLNVLRNGNLLPIDSILVLSMEVSLLTKLFPSALRLVGDHVGLGKLYLHRLNLGAQFGILIVHVSYQTDLHIVKSALFLQLMPLLLENVEGLGHFKLEHEVADKVVDDDVSAQGLGESFGNLGSLAGSILLSCLLQLGLNLERIKVI